MNYPTTPARQLRGTVSVPGDKSILHRAIMIGAVAKGTSEILGTFEAADPLSTLGCVRSLGIQAEQNGTRVMIEGRGLRGLTASRGTLDCGNSGTTMRLLAGLLSGQHFESNLEGDESLSRRPMKRVIEPLSKMGAKISAGDGNTPPLRIAAVDNLKPIEYELPVPSAQVKSAVLLAGLYADGTTRIVEPIPSRDHTERMLGLKSTWKDGARVIEVRGHEEINPRKFLIPGDISSAAFLIAAALLVPDSELCIKDVGLNPTRTAVLDVFRSMGGLITIENERTVEGEPMGDIWVRSSRLSSNIELEGKSIPGLIDELPLIAVTAAFAEGSFSLRNATELRHKESDRIHALVSNLRLLGMDVTEYEDGFAFENKKNLIGSALRTFGDHRIAMAFGVAGLRVAGVGIDDAACVDISFPGFWSTLSKLTQREH